MTVSALAESSTTVDVRGVGLSLTRSGTGSPLLLLDSGTRFEPATRAIDLLARDFEVIAPAHPGFGASGSSPELSTVDDLSYFYLDLLETMDLSGVTLVGVSFGAWIAAAVAVKCTARLSRLVLANPLGIKVSDRETRDIADIFAMTDAELAGAVFKDAALGERTYTAMPEAIVAARSREGLARFGWSPYMHDPKLKARLRRIDLPTLVLRGDADRLTQPGYTGAFRSEIPGAVAGTIADAGHLPHIEQADAFAAAIRAFAATGEKPGLVEEVMS